MTTQALSQQKSSWLDNIPALWLHIAILIVIIAALWLSTTLTSSQAAAEAAATGEASSFELEDMYETWTWIALVGLFVESVIFGIKRKWAFASSVQVSLIVVLSVCFLLITQQEERGIYGVGIFALIIFTLLQIAFGNISPQANFRQSLIGVVITAVIISIVVGLSIWLVPYLIRLGQR